MFVTSFAATLVPWRRVAQRGHGCFAVPLPVSRMASCTTGALDWQNEVLFPSLLLFIDVLVAMGFMDHRGSRK